LEREAVLSDYFRDREFPVDVTIILHSGLLKSYLLADYIGDINLLFFRPSKSHYGRVYDPFLEGIPNNKRDLLLFDDAIHQGHAMVEARDHFLKLDYDRSKIFGYSTAVDRQCRTFPAFFHIDRLEEHLANYNRVEIGV